MVVFARPAVAACLLLMLAVAPVSAQSIGLIMTAGEITRNDPRHDEHENYDEYHFSASVADLVRIEVIGLEGFDPKVSVEQVGGYYRASNDDIDIANNRNALINARVPAAGDYVVRVAGSSGHRGRYQLMVSRRGWGAGTIIEPAHYPNEVLPSDDLRMEQTGHLGPSNPLWNGAYYRDYYVTLPQGDRHVLTLQSNDFDAYLAVFDAADLTRPLAENDDSGDSLDSYLEFTPPHDGNFVVRVSEVDRFAGDYLLEVDGGS